MLELLEYVAIVSLADAFFLTLAYKWHIIEWLQVHADDCFEKVTHRRTDLLFQLFSCNFCMSWWLSWFFSLILLCVTKYLWTLAVPFLATPISKKLLQ